jgi:hypothetical protein
MMQYLVYFLEAFRKLIEQESLKIASILKSKL